MTSDASTQEYLPRVIDSMVRNRLRSAGAVLLEGPKACGKTFTAERVTGSQVYLDLDESALAALRIDPALILTGSPPQLIDEWQLEATRVWNYVRAEVNRRGEMGQFVLTGSAVPNDDARRHTGAGRFARLVMRPMSLFESRESTGEMSLAALLAGERPTAKPSELDVPSLIELVLRGGWPLNLGLDNSAAIRANRDYLMTIAEVDINRIDSARRDPQRATRLLRALARNVAMEHKIARLAREADGEESPLARTTAYEYLNVFERLMVTEVQPAWSTHLRSRTPLRVSPRTHFVDPSLAAAALLATKDSLLKDLNTFGYLFESLAVRDCRIYADPLDATVYHYRDGDKLEVDIVVAAAGGWGAFEVKLGTSQIDTAARSLQKFAQKVDVSKTGPPSVLGVITGMGYGYTREDGIVVVPIGALGP